MQSRRADCNSLLTDEVGSALLALTAVVFVVYPPAAAVVVPLFTLIRIGYYLRQL